MTQQKRLRSLREYFKKKTAYDLEITPLEERYPDTFVAVRDPVTGLSWVSLYNPEPDEDDADFSEYVRDAEDYERFERLKAASADDLDFDTITGAYWYFVDHPGGQGSDEYAWLSALGDIYSGPLETSDRINDTAKEHYNRLQQMNQEMSHGS